MTEHTTHRSSVAVGHRPATIGADPVSLDLASRTDASAALRDDAAVLEVIARRLERLLPTGGTDVRADIALLKMIAGNVAGYAATREAA